MVDLFLVLLSVLGLVIVSVILLIIVMIALVTIGSIIRAIIDIGRGKDKKQELYKTVSDIKEPGVYMATKEGIVKIDDGEK